MDKYFDISPYWCQGVDATQKFPISHLKLLTTASQEAEMTSLKISDISLT